MREAAGQTLKSSLSHTYTRDTRDDRITATRGYYTKLLQEFAGLGGDASHYKTEAEGQISRPVVDGVVSSFPPSTLQFLTVSICFFINLVDPLPCRAYRPDISPRSSDIVLGPIPARGTHLSTVIQIK